MVLLLFHSAAACHYCWQRRAELVSGFCPHRRRTPTPYHHRTPRTNLKQLITGPRFLRVVELNTIKPLWVQPLFGTRSLAHRGFRGRLPRCSRNQRDPLRLDCSSFSLFAYSMKCNESANEWVGSFRNFLAPIIRLIHSQIHANRNWRFGLARFGGKPPWGAIFHNLVWRFSPLPLRRRVKRVKQWGS